MKKIIRVLLPLLIILLPVQVQAVNTSPNSGSLTPGAVININLTASPPSNSTAVQLRLSTNNLEILNYTAPTNNWAPALTGPGCSSSFDSDSVCVDLAKTSGNVTAGESLGTLQVRVANSGSASVNRTSGNGYLVGVNITASSGTAASFTIGAGGSESLPDTALFDDGQPLGLFIGVLVLSGLTVTFLSRLLLAKVFKNIAK